MHDALESAIDGSLLLPNERMTPNNILLLQPYLSTVEEIQAYMETVRSAVYNYQTGYTSKVILNPTEIQQYLSRIRTVTVRIGSGLGEDGVTRIGAYSASILPDLLITLRESALWLCRLYALYVDSQGSIVGPLEDVDIEGTQNGGDVV